MATRKKKVEEKVEETDPNNTKVIKVNPVLIAAADDINQVLGMQPSIDLEANEEDLLTQITTASGEVLAADKKALKPETWGFLEESDLLKHLDGPKKEKTSESDVPAEDSSDKTDTPASEGGTKKPAKTPRKKSATTKKEKTYTRDEAVCEAIRNFDGEFTMANLLAASDKIAVSHGLKSNPTATNVCKYIMVGLVAFGIASVTGKKYIIIK